MRVLEATALTIAGIWGGTRGMPRLAYHQSGSIPAINVSGEQLKAAPPDKNWLSYNGDYSGRRYSGLSQITPDNVAQLRAQWVFHSDNSDRLEVTPLVINGLMLVTSANDTYALDAYTGREIWHHAVPKTDGLIDDAAGQHTRGVA